jgi:hypothetical protein
VNRYNYSYTFCMSFFWWIRLNVSGMLLPAQGICNLGYTKIHMR